MQLLAKTTSALVLVIWYSFTAFASGGIVSTDWSRLYGSDQRKEEPVLYRTCVSNGLNTGIDGPTRQISVVCIHSSRAINESIHDFQILQVMYTDSTSIEFGLLPMVVDAKTSHEMDRNVLRGRIVTLNSSRTGISSVMEGTLYLIWERRGLGTPMFVGRTPTDEPFMGIKPTR